MFWLDVGVLGACTVSVGALALFGAHRFLLLVRAVRAGATASPGQPLDPRRLPLVTVQLPIFNERCVVERLVLAVEALDWPRDRLQVQLLDDSTDDTSLLARAAVEKAQRRGLDIQWIHRTNRSGYKAGALEAALQDARGEFLALFDADFIPQPDFLRRVMPHFTPETGMLQARWGHLNREGSVLARLQAILLDAHFVVEQSARAGSGLWFNFNGTAGVWRKDAIVDAGGWSADTLTEDLDLSYRAQLAGWKFGFLPEVVVPAELPEDMSSFKMQQFRWAKGGIQTACKILPRVFRAQVPRRVKWEAAAHLCSNLAYPFLVCVAVLLPLAIGARARLAPAWMAWIDPLVFVFATLSVALFFLASQLKKDGMGVRGIGWVPLAMALGVGLAMCQTRAVLEALLGRSSPFERTPKSGTVGQAVGSSPYRASSLGTASGEIVFCAWFLWGTVQALQMGLYRSVPLLLLFAVGFGMTGVGSFVGPRLRPSLTRARAQAEAA
jgi:cellulose synthase/poly-beta-1,6-N-acetylglucosamine synthase-like glycosyltransferase